MMQSFKLNWLISLFYGEKFQLFTKYSSHFFSLSLSNVINVGPISEEVR